MASGLHRVLVFAYDFPPCRAPGAAVRTAKFVRYLPEFGWKPTVVCRDDGWGGHREGRDVVAVPAVLSENVSYQAAAWAWAHRVERVARRLLAERTYDLLYATCPPFPHALTAARLSRELAIPLVVDFRDAWSLDPYESGPWTKRLAKRGLRRWVYPRLEGWVLEAAQALVANTPSMAEALHRLPLRRGTLRALVPNGFDAADFEEPCVANPSERVVFLHCGRFDGIAGRSAEPLLAALRIVLDSGRPVALRLLGDASATMRRQVRRHGVERQVSLEDPVAHDRAVREIRHADALVLYQAAGRGPVTPVAGKTFEYVRSGRPILAIVPPGDNAALLREHALSYQRVSSSVPGAVAEAMCVMADAHPMPTREPRSAFDAYERRALTRRLAQVFDGAVAPRTRAADAAVVA